MYFGSVRFFKHCIICMVFGVIAILGIIVAVLMLSNGEKDGEIAELKEKNSTLEAVVAFNDGNGEFTTEDYYNLMKHFGIDSNAFLEYLYEKDKEAFEKLVISASATTSIAETFPTVPLPEITTTTTPEVTETTSPPETEFYAPYMDLYPHLYAVPDVSGGYEADDDYVYLTFDDGPSVYTGSVLSILKKHNVNATFFVIPDDSESCKQYLNTMLDSGHSLGIHSASHDYDKIYASVEAFLDDFSIAFNLVYEQTGYKPYLYRFPGGSINDFNTETREEIINEMNRRGFIYYDWNVDSRDAAGATWTQMYDSVLKDIANLNRAVVLFHDGPGRQNTVYVLEDILLGLEQGSREYKLSAIKENTRPVQH